STGRRAAVPAEAIRPIPGYSLNIPRGRNDFPNAIIVPISDEDVPRTVNEHTPRIIELSAGGQTAVATRATIGPVPGNGFNVSCSSNHFPNAIVARIRNEDVPGTVNVHVLRKIQCAADGRTSIPAEAIASIPGYGLNITRRSNYFPDSIVAGICNEDVTRTVNEYCKGVPECSTGRRAAVPAEAHRPIPGYGLNIPRGRNDFPNAIIVPISDEDVPRTVDEYCRGASEFSAGGRAAVPAIAVGFITGDRR